MFGGGFNGLSDRDQWIRGSITTLRQVSMRQWCIPRILASAFPHGVTSTPTHRKHVVNVGVHSCLRILLFTPFPFYFFFFVSSPLVLSRSHGKCSSFLLIHLPTAKKKAFLSFFISHRGPRLWWIYHGSRTAVSHLRLREN